MKALVIGTSGATGMDLLQVLLDSEDYTEVVAFVRKPLNIEHPRLSCIVTDFMNLEAVAQLIKGDVWFSCLGTTLKAAGSKDQQRTIDFDIPAAFADIARRNEVARAVLLSAYGAKANSSVFYSKLKGELEEHIKSLAFTQFIIFRPGMLIRKDTDRTGEKITASLLSFLNQLGLIRKFRPMPTAVLAQKLAKAPINLPNGVHIIELEKIWEF